MEKDEINSIRNRSSKMSPWTSLGDGTLFLLELTALEGMLIIHALLWPFRVPRTYQVFSEHLWVDGWVDGWTDGWAGSG